MAASTSTAQAETGEDCENMKFAVFIRYCDKIYSTKERPKKIDLLRSVFEKYRNKSASLFPIMRLLLPQWDRERTAYGLRENVLAHKYIKSLALPPKDRDAVKLLNFRNPMKAGSSVGDFAEVAYSILKASIVRSDSNFTVKDINRHLSSMAFAHSNKNPGGMASTFNILVDSLSALEQKWLIRILLKSMHLGLGHKAIFHIFHPDAAEMHDACTNLLKVCETLKNPSIRLNEIEISLFSPFRPMLSERCDVQLVNISEPHYIETKWDGERFQLHYSNKKFKYFSRRSFDFTYTYGEDAGSGYFSPKIAGRFSESVNSCILDGEMMGWNTNRKKFATKGMNFDVKMLKETNILQPCFCVFDVLYLNGTVITNKPYEERIKLLDTIFEPLEGVIIQTTRTIANTTQEVLDALNRAIDQSEEGIVMKHPKSVYKPNSRNTGWFKIKPEYTDGAMEELDLLIVGGYYGEGRQSGIISHFLLALAKASQSISPSLLGEFVTVSRVGSGLSGEELLPLCDRLKPHWQKYDASSNPDFLICSKEKPELWIKPDQSVILQIKASEIIRSDLFAAGYSLRFARIEKIRYDKPWYDCMKTDEFERLRRIYDGKLTAGYIMSSAGAVIEKKRKAKSDLHPGPKHIKMETESDIFQGKEIHVVTGSEEFSVEALRLIILKHKGRVIDAPVSTTYCIVAGKVTLRVKNLIASRKHNVVKLDWIIRCDTNKRLLPKLRDDFISMTPETDAAVTTLVEKYSVEDEDLPTYDYICEVVNNLEQYKDATISESDIGELYYLLFRNTPSNLFKNVSAYFDIYSKVNVKNVSEILDVSHIYTQMYFFYLLGGKYSSLVNSTISLVFMHDDFLENLETFKKLQLTLKFKIISYRWIMDCVKSGTLEDLAEYAI